MKSLCNKATLKHSLLNKKTVCAPINDSGNHQFYCWYDNPVSSFPQNEHSHR